LQQRGSENSKEEISEEYEVEGGQKDVYRKAEAGPRSVDVEAAQSLRGSRVPV